MGDCGFDNRWRLLRRILGGKVGETLEEEILVPLPGLQMDDALRFGNRTSNVDRTGIRSARNNEHSGMPADMPAGFGARFGVLSAIFDESTCIFGVLLKIKPVGGQARFNP